MASLVLQVIAVCALLRLSQAHSKGVIIYLAESRAESVSLLLHSLASLDAHYNNRWQAPVIIFHPVAASRQNKGSAGHPLTPEQQKQVREATTSAITFAEVDFGSAPLAPPPHAPAMAHNKPLGYRQMCNFFAFHFADHDALVGYDYVLRFDGDAVLLEDVPLDLFSAMEVSNWTYAWRSMACESEDVVKGLEETVARHFGLTSLCGHLEPALTSPACTNSLNATRGWSRTMYYNNFEVVRLAWLRSAEYRKLAAALAAAEGVWMERWGDAPIRTLAVQLLLPRAQVHRFVEVAYYHPSSEYKLSEHPDPCLECAGSVCSSEHAFSAAQYSLLAACAVSWCCVLARGRCGRLRARLIDASTAVKKITA